MAFAASLKEYSSSVWVLALAWLACVSVLAEAGSVGCPRLCTCQASVVDCSGRGLTSATLPVSFPAATAELRLHSNALTWLPMGVLDSLPALRSLTLHANAWHCDCSILYLRSYLLTHNNHALIRNVSCSSPPRLKGGLVVYLGEEEILASCRYWFCDLALTSQISLLIFILIQGLLLASVLIFLRRFERLTREARRTNQESLTQESANTGNEYVMLKERNT